MNEIRYTLLTDGSSDKSLMRVLDWLLESLLPEVAIQSEWADLRRLRNPPKSLDDRITASLDYYPCELLFIHRDAEREPLQNRISEIEEAVEEVIADSCVSQPLHWIPVIPIRMTEAWLLIDESAIRKAAGNPRGKQSLNLPAVNRLESLPNPKKTLQDLIKQANTLPSRRQRKVSNHRIAELIRDFSPLDQLSAFQQLRSDVTKTLKNIGYM